VDVALNFKIAGFIGYQIYQIFIGYQTLTFDNHHRIFIRH